jgi:uncharacterized protein YcfJ
MKTKAIIAVCAGAILLVGVTAAASVYTMNASDEAEKTATVVSTQERVNFNQARQEPAPVPACDDDNIVGKVIGGAAGGLAGNQIGDGNGQTAATIGGAVGGTILGEKYIPTKDVTCR